MSFVASAVGSAVGWVGDAVSGVVDFVVDDILSPVIDGVAGFVEGIANDPLGSIMMIAAAATGNPFIIAAASGARTAMNGGDIGDVLLSAVASYAGAEIGSYVGDSVSSAVGGGPVGTIAGKAAAGATRGAVSAAFTGGDIGKAALYGGLSSGASAGLSEAFSGLSDLPDTEGGYNSFDPDDIGSVDDIGNDLFSSGAADYSGFEGLYETNFSSVKGELLDLVDGFNELPEVVRDMVTGSATAAVTSLAMEGEINPDDIAAALGKAVITTGVVKNLISESDFFTGDTDEARTRTALITKVTSDAIEAAYEGTDPYLAATGVFDNFAMLGIAEEIENADLGGIIDEISGAQETFLEAKDRQEQAVAEREQIADIARGEYDAYQALVEEFNEDIRYTDKESADAFLLRIDEARDALQLTITSLEESDVGLASMAEDYRVASEFLVSKEQLIDQAIVPAQQVATKSIVEALTADPETLAVAFNPEEYAQLNNLEVGVDPYAHWLATGRKNSINQADYDSRLDQRIRNEANDLVLQNVDTKFNSLEDIDDFYAAVKAGVGNDINADTGTIRAAAQQYIASVESSDAGVGPASVVRNASVTDYDIINGTAVPTYDVDGDGNLTIKYVTTTGGPRIFSPELNQYVTPEYDAASGQNIYRDLEGVEITGFFPEETRNAEASRQLMTPPILMDLNSRAPNAAIATYNTFAANDRPLDKYSLETAKLIEAARKASSVDVNNAIGDAWTLGPDNEMFDRYFVGSEDQTAFVDTLAANPDTANTRLALEAASAKTPEQIQAVLAKADQTNIRPLSEVFTTLNPEVSKFSVGGDEESLLSLFSFDADAGPPPYEGDTADAAYSYYLSSDILNKSLGLDNYVPLSPAGNDNRMSVEDDLRMGPPYVLEENKSGESGVLDTLGGLGITPQGVQSSLADILRIAANTPKQTPNRVGGQQVQQQGQFNPLDISNLLRPSTNVSSNTSEVNTPENAAEIDQQYDILTGKFVPTGSTLPYGPAITDQDALLGNPLGRNTKAAGGLIEDRTDEILRIMGRR